jgi:hypothetical protein
MKLPVLTLIVFLLFAFSFVGLNFVQGNFFPDPGPDLPRIYIRSDGNVEPATAPIERTGNLYKLTGDIVLSTLEIQRGNIVLDGSGFLVLGNGSWLGSAPYWRDAGNNGVIIAEQTNVTIIRLAVEQCTTGIRVVNSSNINIIYNAFTNESSYSGDSTGIVIKDSSNVLIENNLFSSFTGSAIACNGTSNIIRANTILDIGTNIDGSIALEGSSNVVSENSIKVDIPISLERATSNIISWNNLSGPTPSPESASQTQNRTGNEAIVLNSQCSNNLIFGNNITGFCNQAICLIFNCSNNTFCGNYLANNGFAAAIPESAVDNLFYGNTFAADSCRWLIDDGLSARCGIMEL